MTSFLLAIDQGTTSSRAIVFDGRASIRGLAQHPTIQDFPHPGWVNQRSEDIWQTTLTSINESVSAAGIEFSALTAIGVANQRETTILWDRETGEPVAPAIVWQSRQSSEIVDDLIRRGQSGFYQRTTGLVPDAYFSATKIAWLLENVPDLRRRAEDGQVLFGTVDTWLLWNLTGGKVHLTDVANASRTMLLDLRSLEWSTDILDDLAIPRTILPEIRSNSELLAVTDPDLFGAEIPIAGSAGDQHAALFGQACFAPGQGKNTYGTGSFLLMNVGSRPVESDNRLLSTVAWSVDGDTNYALEGSIFVTGSAVQWLRDGLGIIAQSSDVETLAATVDDSDGVVFVPALVGLGAPYWDSGARGTITGITRGTTGAHIAYATLEAIAHQTRDVVDAMAGDAGFALSELRVDGGMTANNLLMQMQADVLGVPVIVPKIIETTALGAAYLAGLATGVWSSQSEIANLWQEDRRFEPRMSESDRDVRYRRWLDAVTRSRSTSR